MDVQQTSWLKPSLVVSKMIVETHLGSFKFSQNARLEKAY